MFAGQSVLVFGNQYMVLGLHTIGLTMEPTFSHGMGWIYYQND